MPQRLTPRLIAAYRDQSWTYEVFKPRGRPHIVCPQCRALILLLENLSPEVRAEIAKLRLGGEMIAAVNRLRAVADCDLGQAKANLLHICAIGPKCHKCATPLQPGSLLCPVCFSVNLTWA